MMQPVSLQKRIWSYIVTNQKNFNPIKRQLFLIWTGTFANNKLVIFISESPLYTVQIFQPDVYPFEGMEFLFLLCRFLISF